MDPGTYIWARIGSKFSPGVVIAAEDVGMNPPTAGNIHVYWFGDNRVSTVPTTRTLPFGGGFRRVYLEQRTEMGQRWKAGVLEAIIEYSDLDENTGYQEAIDYACATYNDLDHIGKIAVPLKVSIQLSKRLLGQWSHYNTIKRNHVLREYVTAGRNINRLCLACYSQHTACGHPYFDGKLCHDCKKKLYHTLMWNPTHKYMYCVICGNDISISRCKRPNCKKPFCGHCIKNFLLIVKPSEWHCFVCVPEQTDLIKLRPDYAKKVIEFIAPNAIFRELQEFNVDQKNIMILFHGKSEVIPTLCSSDDLLSIVAPTDEICGYTKVKNMIFPFLNACFINYSIGPTVWISDMDQRSIDSWKLTTLGTVDILIGGTSYMGLKIDKTEDDFQGQLFWEFHRIFYLTKVHNWKVRADLKFIFEINPTISKIFMDIITRYLEVTPYCIQTPEGEYRMIWTNIQD